MTKEKTVSKGLYLIKSPFDEPIKLVHTIVYYRDVDINVK